MSTRTLIPHRKVDMGKIVVSVTIQNTLSPERSILCEAMVDTGAMHMTLPMAWKDQLGDIQVLEEVDVETADQRILPGEICGPVMISIAGFRAVSCEVLFIDMESPEGSYEPLIGYLVLEAIPVAVDMLGHRLVPVRYVDLK